MLSTIIVPTIILYHFVGKNVINFPSDYAVLKRHPLDFFNNSTSFYVYKLKIIIDSLGNIEKKKKNADEKVNVCNNRNDCFSNKSLQSGFLFP